MVLEYPTVSLGLIINLLTHPQRQTDTVSPSFDGMLDSLVSTPEHPSSPSAADLGLETSSVGSQLSGSLDRPFLLRTSFSHSQRHVDGSFVGAPESYSANHFYTPPTA